MDAATKRTTLGGSRPEMNTRGQTRFTLAEPGEKPYRYMYKDPEHTLKKGEFLDSDGIVSACRNQMTELDVLDGRGEEFSVQQNGFQLVTHSTPMPQSPTLQELDDLHQWVRRHALPAACNAVRAAFGDEQPLGTAIFDYTLRITGDFGKVAGAAIPVIDAHCDFTPESGPRRLAQALAGTNGQAFVHEEGLSTKEWGDYEVRFVNCWQPLREVYKKPLMVCDTQSLDPADLIARDFIFRERVGNTYGVRFNKDQKWYYFPRMTPKEVLVFKVFDSNTAAARRFTPHSGFTDLLDDEPFPRQSVEIRCAAVFPKKA